MLKKAFVILFTLIISILSNSNYVDGTEEINFIEKEVVVYTAATPSGCLDVANGETIEGWAWRSDIPNNAIDVHIYLYNDETGKQYGPYSVRADIYREDLKNAGIGNGKHGFKYTVNQALNSGRYKVVVYAIGENGNNNPSLSNCPKYFNVTNPEGCLDFVDSSLIEGWAWRSSSPNSSTIVMIILKNVTTGKEYGATITAGIYREDLKNSGFGNGKHGFSYDINWTLYPQGTYTVSVYAFTETIDYELVNSPKSYYSQWTAYVVGGKYTEEEYEIDSEIGAQNSYKTYSDMGFNTILEFNPNYNTLTGSVNGRKKLESDIIFLISHGSNYKMEFLNSGIRTGATMDIVISGKENREVKAIGTNDINWNRVKLAVFAGCETAQGQNNLLYDVVTKGADVAIGFEERIEEESLFEWCEIFNENLKKGKTMQEIYSIIKKEEFKDNRVGNFKIQGDKSLYFQSNESILLNAIENENIGLIPSEEIIYNEENLNNIIEFIEKNIEGFDGDEYETYIGGPEINGVREPVVNLKRKIGDFYTGDAFVIIIKDGLVSEIIDHREKEELTEEEKKELREFKLSEEKIREYKEKAIGGGSIDPDDERVYYRLSYDRETKKKYIEVIVPVIDAYGDTVSLRNEEYEL